MIVVDDFLDRVPSSNYKCYDFVREVWLASYGIDIGERLQTLLTGRLKGFKKLTKPFDPCFVVFQRKRTVPHIGIWYCGRVLHLMGGQSAQYSRLDDIARRYTKVSYYR